MKKYIYILIAVMIVLLVGCNEDTVGNDLTGSISGTVTSGSSGEPIENVEISTSPASTTVLTDENGKFVLENVIVDQYSVKTESEDYISAFKSVTVTADVTSNVIFKLVISSANNRQPSAPVAVAPLDNASVTDLDVDFAWDSTDPDGDDLTFELKIRNDRNDDVLMFSNIQDTTYNVSDLKYGYKYFWQVAVSDSINDPVLSQVYSFRITEFPDNSYYYVREIENNNVIFSSNEKAVEVRLTDLNKNSFRPRKNNSINRVAFLRIVGSSTQLFTMKPDGSDVLQVTSSIPVKSINNERVGYSWSNDGSFLLYPNLDKLYKIRATGEGKEIVYDAPAGRFIINTTVSADNSVIVLHTTDVNGYNAEIFTIDFNGNRKKTIVNNVMGSLGGLDIDVTNSLVLYTRDESGFESAENRELNTKMFIYNLENDSEVGLSGGKDNGTNDTNPRFSPDEAAVIFVNASNALMSNKNIYTLRFDEDLNPLELDRILLIENAKMPDWE
jgi:hypothetical protein